LYKKFYKKKNIRKEYTLKTHTIKEKIDISHTIKTNQHKLTYFSLSFITTNIQFNIFTVSFFAQTYTIKANAHNLDFLPFLYLVKPIKTNNYYKILQKPKSILLFQCVSFFQPQIFSSIYYKKKAYKNFIHFSTLMKFLFFLKNTKCIYLLKYLINIVCIYTSCICILFKIFCNGFLIVEL
jgi:hypothetical protein